MKNGILKIVSAIMMIVAVGIALVAVDTADVHLTAIGIFAVPALWFAAQGLTVFVDDEIETAEDADHPVAC